MPVAVPSTALTEAPFSLQPELYSVSVTVPPLLSAAQSLLQCHADCNVPLLNVPCEVALP